MKYIPISIDLRSAPTELMPSHPLLICTYLDHDLAVNQLRRIGNKVEKIHIYNLLINGISVRDRLFLELSKLCDFLDGLISYCEDNETETFCSLRIAEFLAYHRVIEQDTNTVLYGLNVNKVVEHSFDLSRHPEQLQDNLDYINVNSLSGNYAVAFKELVRNPILASATIYLNWFEKKINQYASLFELPLSHSDKISLYSLRKHFWNLQEDEFVQFIKSAPDWQKFKPL